jgi:hypothetical protein
MKRWNGPALRTLMSEPPFAYGRQKPQCGEINSAGPSTAPLLKRAFIDLLR